MNALMIHRRESTEYLQPAHIIKLAARVRRERRIEEAKSTPLAISQRTAPPPDFRAQIAAATTRLGELTSNFGKMPASR